NGSIISIGRKKENGTTYWTNYVDNEKFDPSEKYVTILPSSGNNPFVNRNGNNEIIDEPAVNSYLNNFRIIWESDYLTDIFEGKDLPQYDRYFKDVEDNYSIGDNNKKVIDLMAT